MKKVLIIMTALVFACLITFFSIKKIFFNNYNFNQPIENVIKYYNKAESNQNFEEAITKEYKEETSILKTYDNSTVSDDDEEEEKGKYPYSVPPKFEDDGSIIYEGMTLTELTNQLNKSLKGYLVNTGIFFAEYTKDTGLDPYLAVSITLLETGCNWQCSTLTRECNNIGGLKGSGSCNGGSYSKYSTLEQGITAYLNIIYNNYYLKGLTTPEQMNPYYAASSQWANKVNTYINSVRNK